MGRIDVVIPVVRLGDAERTVDCLIRSCEPGLLQHISVVLAPHHKGCVGQYRAGAFGALAKYVLLLNDDAFPTGRALTELVAIMDADPKIGAIGPSMPTQTHQGKLYPPEQRTVVEVPFVVASCMLLRNQALRDTGIDAAYEHWAFDLDLCYRLRERGWRIAWAQHVWVNHLHTQPGEISDPELEAIAKRDHARLAQVWGDRLGREGAISVEAVTERPHTPDGRASVARLHADILAKRGPVPTTWDLGCGEGWGAEHYDHSGAYLGVDRDPTAIEHASRRCPHHMWICTDLETWFPSRGQADRILMIHVLEHLTRPETVLERAASWLAPEGEIIVATPLEARTVWNPHHVSYFTAARLHALLTPLFEQVEVVEAGRDLQAWAKGPKVYAATPA